MYASQCKSWVVGSSSNATTPYIAYSVDGVWRAPQLLPGHFSSVATASHGKFWLALAQNEKVGVAYYCDGALDFASQISQLTDIFNLKHERSNAILFGRNSDGLISSSYFNGTTWSTPAVVPGVSEVTIANNYADTRFDLSGQYAALIATTNDGDHGVAIYDGSSWSAPVVLQDSNGEEQRPTSIKMLGDKIWVITADADNSNVQHLFYYNGTSWSQVIPTDSTYTFTSYSYLYTVGDSVWVAGNDGDQSNIELYAEFASDGTYQFYNQNQVGVGGLNMSTIAGDVQGVFAVYDKSTTSEDGPGVYMQSLDNGSWRATQRIFRPEDTGTFLSIDKVRAAGGFLVVVSSQFDFDSWSSTRFVTYGSGTEVSGYTTKALSTLGLSSVFRMAVSGGQIWLYGQDSAGNNKVVHYNGQDWSTLTSNTGLNYAVEGIS